MTSDTPACGRSFLNYKDHPDRSWPPSLTIEDNLRCQALLDIQPPERFFDRRDFRLDFDDERDLRGGIDAKDVDGAALPVFSECHLEEDVPTKPSQAFRSGRDQACVAFIKDPIEIRRAPDNPSVEPRVKRAERRPDGAYRQQRDMTSFDERYRRLRHACRPRNIRLSQATTAP